MNVISRFNGEKKRLNLVERNSFETRCILSILRYNNGVKWHFKAWKQCFHCDLTIFLKNMYMTSNESDKIKENQQKEKDV